MKQLVLCVDLEQDDIRSSVPALFAWKGAERALQWRHTLPWPSAALNWFVRADVQTRTVLGDASWPLRHLYPALCDALDLGDTVGAHPHLYRDGPDGWRNDYADPDFAWQCAEVALDAHAAVFGAPCRTWRWGDRAGQPSLRPRLAAAGVVVDNTAEPGRPPLPPLDGGAGLPPSWVGHRTEPQFVDGLVDWPVSTVALAGVTAPACNRHAAVPVGSFDAINDHWLHGWCCDATAGCDDTAVDVELLVHGSVVAVTAADWYRPDVAAAGYGDGRHGARIGMRDEWRSLPADAFQLRAAGHLVGLFAPPNDDRTGRGAESTVMPLPMETEPEQFARMIAVVLRDDASHVTLAIRSDALLDPTTAAALDRNVATLAGYTADGTLSSPQSLLTLAAPLLRA